VSVTESGGISHLKEALRRSWGPDTCAPEDQPAWHRDNPARGQCITTVLVVHDMFGGSLVRAEVHVDGAHVDYHWWNRLPDGSEVDLTRDQFGENEVVIGGTSVARPSDAGRVREQYARLKARVHDEMHSPPGPAAI